MRGVGARLMSRTLTNRADPTETTNTLDPSMFLPRKQGKEGKLTRRDQA